jgi:hypothetical protein
MDASNKTIAWRGLAIGELGPPPKPDKREKNIQRAAARLFKYYPRRT